MKKVELIINGIVQSVTIERYFKLADQAYVIYSDGSSDADGNVKIFVAKVIDNQQVLPIDTQEEWDRVKNAIVGIVNDNKECNKLGVEDLNYHLLKNLEITDARALRLPVAVMPYLSANTPDFNNIELSESEQALEEKTESLKEMNADLTNLMDEVNQEFSKIEDKKDENLEATMEIIMPSKPLKEEKEEHKKKKGKFSLKNIFGKKSHEDTEEVKEEENTEVALEQPVTMDEPVEISNEVEQSISTDQPIETANEIVHETELPTPVALDPIVVDDIPVVENEEQSSIIPEPTIEYSVSEPENDAVELQKDMSSRFEFFNVNEEPTNVVAEEITSNVDTASKEEPMEILEVNDDSEYKKLYEEEKKNNEMLEEKNKKLEELIKVYHEKLTQIRYIVR